MKSLKGTKTAEILMRSFAGESQARTRYNMYAKVAKKAGYEEIAKAFEETADQEKTHAKVFFDFLYKEFNGEKIVITADYPVDMYYDDTLACLKAAIDSEREENSMLYPEEAEIVEKEGFKAIADIYRKIASIEALHEKKFRKFIDQFEKEGVFKRDKKTKWYCQSCGYIYEAQEAPEKCPVCKYPKAFFKEYTE